MRNIETDAYRALDRADKLRRDRDSMGAVLIVFGLAAFGLVMLVLASLVKG